MHNKMIAVLVAMLMVFVTGAAMVNASESEACVENGTNVHGEMNVYLSSDIEEWNVDTEISAYNAYQAITTSSFANHSSLIPDVIDGAYTVLVDGDPYDDYYNINEDYGTITTFYGLSNNTNYWNLLVYSGSWSLASDNATGFYKPFADYATYLPDYGTANVALYYGTASDASDAIEYLEEFISESVDNSTIALTAIDTSIGSDYEVTFNFTDTTGTISGMPSTATGYGSDVYQALINAVGSNNISSNGIGPVPGYYGYSWIQYLFGVGTTADWSLYWTSYIGNGTSVYCEFNLGAYSPLDCSPTGASVSTSSFHVSGITLVY